MTEQLELWYKRPGSDEYEKINEILDSIFNKLEDLEEIDFNPGLTD